MKTVKIIYVTIACLIVSLASSGQISQELTEACKKGNLSAVKKAVDGGADVNALRSDGVPIMGEAMFWPEITQYLIDKGADPNGGSTPLLMVAASSYSFEVMEVLLKNGADPNKPQVKTSLHPIANLIKIEKAKKKPNKKLIKTWESQLSAAGGNMDEIKTKTTVLENTINTTNCIPCIELLLKYKANPNVKDAVGNDMLINSVMRWMDISQNFISYGSMLQKLGYKVPVWWNQRVSKGTSAEEVSILIKYEADVNYQNTVNGVTPLIAALGSKYAEGAKILIKNGADVSIMTPNKKDALSVATELGDLELIKLIVSKGADVNRETWGLDQKSGQYAKGFTPLTIAVIYNHVDIAKYLIDVGSKPKEGISGYYVNPKSGCPFKLKNKTAIYFAIEQNNMEMVKMLTDNFKMWNLHNMEMKQPEKSYDVGNIQITNCYKIKGSFSPSLYAKKLGYNELKVYLKSKGL